MEQCSDEQLVEQIRQAGEGDYSAFDVLVERYQRRVMANCRHLTGVAADAEDLAQEVFVKVFFGLQRFEGRSKFRTWIQRIKINHCLTYNAKKRNRFAVSTDEQVEERSEVLVDHAAAAKVAAVDARQGIRRVLDGMPESLRVPLILRDADGFSYQEIADEMAIGLSAVKMRIKRGREEFRRRYRELHRELHSDDDTARPATQRSS